MTSFIQLQPDSKTSRSQNSARNHKNTKIRNSEIDSKEKLPVSKEKFTNRSKYSTNYSTEIQLLQTTAPILSPKKTPIISSNQTRSGRIAGFQAGNRPNKPKNNKLDCFLEVKFAETGREEERETEQFRRERERDCQMGSCEEGGF